MCPIGLQLTLDGLLSGFEFEKQKFMKYTNDDFEVMAGRYVAENLDTTSIPYEHGFIKGFVAECIHLQNLQQTDVGGSLPIDWVVLREKYFSECTVKDSVDGLKVRIDFAPHNLFQWFKKEIQQGELISHNVKVFMKLWQLKNLPLATEVHYLFKD